MRATKSTIDAEREKAKHQNRLLVMEDTSNPFIDTCSSLCGLGKDDTLNLQVISCYSGV